MSCLFLLKRGASLCRFGDSVIFTRPNQKNLLIMSRVCQVTGKRPVAGNNVSHAHNKTRRRFMPNIQSHRFWVESENRWVKLRLSTKGMRIIDKKGIDEVLTDVRNRGIKV